jgi:pimeloyl-ACP methyl ester carboxylesterase
VEKHQKEEEYRLAYRLRRTGPKSIIFIHGLGAAKNSFETCFGLKSFRNYTLGAVDLPGCGESEELDDFSYSMEDQAGLVLKWIIGLDIDRITLVGHSMGGVIGLYLAEALGQKVKAFFNMEGNLNPKDTIYSGKIASLPLEVFEGRGYQLFKRMLKETLEKSRSPGMRIYYENISKASPRALYLSAVSLLKESYEGNLYERFLKLPVRKWYVFGEKSLNRSTRILLDKDSLPYFIVPESGHFMMDDQPETFYRMLLDALKKRESTY